MSANRRPDRLIYKPPSNRNVAVGLKNVGDKSFDDADSRGIAFESDNSPGTLPSEHNIVSARRNAPGNRSSGSNRSPSHSHGMCKFKNAQSEALPRNAEKSKMSLHFERNGKLVSDLIHPTESEVVNPSSRHGGIIHLPKNVNIFNQSSPNQGTSSNSQGGICYLFTTCILDATSSRPVLVVRPHQRPSMPLKTRLQSSNKTGVQSRHESPRGGTGMSALPTISTSTSLRRKDIQLFEQPNEASSLMLAQLSRYPRLRS